MPVRGQGPHQQAILGLMADGETRTAPEIGAHLRIDYKAVGEAVSTLGQNGMLRAADKRGDYGARLWTITTQGRGAILN